MEGEERLTSQLCHLPFCGLVHLCVCVCAVFVLSVRASKHHMWIT